MIEGLKVTVSGTELRELCMKRAAHHRERAKVYEGQRISMEQNEIEGMNYSNGDPKRVLKDKWTEHESEAAELEFIAEHLVPVESYLLDAPALAKLGIARSRW